MKVLKSMYFSASKASLLGVLAGLSLGGCGDSSPSEPTPDTTTTQDTTVGTDTSPGDTTVTPECNTFKCVDGVASRCDGSESLSCASVGAVCEAFTSDAGAEAWCNCGSFAEGGGTCLTTTGGAICQDGASVTFECDGGTTCDSAGGVVACVCDNADDSVCPDVACTEDPDCAQCTPSCGAAECGDNGCGGVCGTCQGGEICDSGTCKTPAGPAPVDLINDKVLRVFAFALSDTHVYFSGLGFDARQHTYRCPIAGCAADAEELSSGSYATPSYQDVEVAGDYAYWVQDKDQIWRANVGGATPGAAALGYDGDGAYIYGMRVSDENLFAVAQNPISNGPYLWALFPSDGGAVSTNTTTLSALVPNFNNNPAVFDVGGGIITAWVGRVPAPAAIQEVTVGGTTAVTNPIAKVSVNGIVRFGNQLAWLDDTDSPTKLMACTVGTDCLAPHFVANATSLAVDGDSLYYVTVYDSNAHVEKCPITALDGSCTPTNVSTSIYWLGVRNLRVHGDYVYGVPQDGAGLVRASK